jgi:CBS domain containing-hemolysin-like protein
VRGPDGGIAGTLHVRDALLAGDQSHRAEDLTFPVPRLPATTSVLQAVATLQAAHAQLALVTGADGAVTGLLSLDDLLSRLLEPTAAA